MATVSPISSVSVRPAFRAENDSKTQEIVQIMEENSKTTKLCAGAALAASVATLIPLSILAVRTGKISKIADDVKGITGAARKATEDVSGLVNDAINKGKVVLDGVSKEQLARGKELVNKGFDDLLTAGETILTRVKDEFARGMQEGAEFAEEVATRAV